MTNLPPGGEGTLNGELMLPFELNRGEVSYTAIIYYDDNQFESKRETFEIGEKVVEISGFSPYQLTSGKVNKLVVTLKNWWSSPLKTYVSGTLNDNLSNKKLTSFTTDTFEMSGSDAKETYIYLDLSEVKEGDYLLNITSYFDESLSWSKVVPIKVVTEALPKEALLIPQKAENGNGWMYLLVVVGVALVIVIILVYFYNRKGEKEEL